MYDINSGIILGKYRFTGEYVTPSIGGNEELLIVDDEEMKKAMDSEFESTIDLETKTVELGGPRVMFS